MSTKSQHIDIYDTTLRDGTQAEGVSLSLEDKLLIAEALDNLGVDYIEGGYPLSNPKDEAFFSEIRKRKLKHAKLAAFGMTRRKDRKAADDEGMRALLGSGAAVVTIVGKSWELHLRDVLKVSAKENLAMIHDSLAIMVKDGRETIYDAEHFFDGYRDNPPFALETLKAAVEAGATCVVLCDTNGGALPELVGEATEAAAGACPGVQIGIHCHNDGGLGLANTLVSVRRGATHVQGTINGIGERTGNADLTAIVPNLVLKYGYKCLRPSTLKNLTEVSRFVYEVANLNLRENQPFVGAAAFAHKGGMHASAIARNVLAYEHITPTAVGNRRRVLISEVAGVSNIAATVPKKFKVADDRPAQRKVLKAIKDMENAGYQFEAAEASFEVLVRKTLGGNWYRKLWELDHYRCVILKRNATAANTEAIVKLSVDGKVQHMVAEGDGPVDSLNKAIGAALRSSYPNVDDLHLVNYKVRVVNTAAETAAKVRVVIDWHDASGEAYFGSVGVSENIIDASFLALTDAIEYKLLNSLEKG